MEHIFQIAINVDDQRIQESVYKSAETEIVRQCAQEFKKVVFNCDRWGQAGVSEWTKDQFAAFMERNRDEIIEKAAEVLADRLSRSKAVREVAGEVARANR